MGKKCNKYFEFESWSRYHFIALAVPICCMLTTYIQKNELKYYNENLLECKEKTCIKEFPYFFNIFISKNLSIFLVLISKYMNKDRSNLIVRSETKKKRRYHLSVNNISKKIKSAFLLICISILELIFKVEGYLIIGMPNYIELKLGFLLIVPLLSVFILKKQLYIHHLFAFIICSIAFIIVCCSIIFYENKPSVLEQLRHLSFSIPLALAFVLIKYLFENSFINAFSFLFYDGILCIIIPIITIAIMSIFKDSSSYFIDNIKEVSLLFKDKKIFGKFAMVVVFSFLYYLTNALTIYIFNPSLMVMTDILSPIFRWVIEIFLDKEYNEQNFLFIVIFKGLGFFLIIFCSVVFNEILIFHFCGLDNNIESNIHKRGKTEVIANSENNSFSFSKDYEEEGEEEEGNNKSDTTIHFETEMSVI